MSSPKKIFIIHDWIDSIGGAEKVLQAILELFPPTRIKTLLANPASDLTKSIKPLLETSILQKIPGGFHFHRYLLQFYPHLIERFDLREADLILSSSHCVAKGVLTRADQLHISYLHTPVRYAWDQYFEYVNSSSSFLKRIYMRYVLKKLRLWDFTTNPRVDLFLANSQHVAKRIWRAYRRPSIVVYPFVDLELFKPSPSVQKKNHFVVISRLVVQKRVDLAVSACSKLGISLKVIGDGPERQKLEAIAAPCVEFLGSLPIQELKTHVESSQGLIFPQEEDFGIVPLEAQALGIPVLAFGVGGALETVVDGITGRFFPKQTVESLAEALKTWKPNQFLNESIRAQAKRFSRQQFDENYREIVNSAWECFKKDGIFNDTHFVAAFSGRNPSKPSNS